MMKTIKLAVPSAAPGGLEAGYSEHFGHCDVFTLLTVGADGVDGVEIMPNQHDGGCGSVVAPLKHAGVESIVVRGIGMRPLLLFQQAGIQVLKGSGPTVGDAVAAYQSGQVVPVDPRDACGGGPDHQH